MSAVAAAKLLKCALDELRAQHRAEAARSHRVSGVRPANGQAAIKADKANDRATRL
jgi:hypothetical protein